MGLNMLRELVIRILNKRVGVMMLQWEYLLVMRIQTAEDQLTSSTKIIMTQWAWRTIKVSKVLWQTIVQIEISKVCSLQTAITIGDVIQVFWRTRVRIWTRMKSCAKDVQLVSSLRRPEFFTAASVTAVSQSMTITVLGSVLALVNVTINISSYIRLLQSSMLFTL